MYGNRIATHHIVTACNHIATYQVVTTCNRIFTYHIVTACKPYRRRPPRHRPPDQLPQVRYHTKHVVLVRTRGYTVRSDALPC